MTYYTLAGDYPESVGRVARGILERMATIRGGCFSYSVANGVGQALLKLELPFRMEAGDRATPALLRTASLFLRFFESAALAALQHEALRRGGVSKVAYAAPTDRPGCGGLSPMPTPTPAARQQRRRHGHGHGQPRWSEPRRAIKLSVEYQAKQTGLLCLVAGLLDASPLPRFKLAEVQLLRTGRAIQAAHRR